MTAKPTPHTARVDPDLPPDINGHAVCRCGLLILPGDPRHDMPDVPEQALARARVDPHDE
jgi:hypothetical protein